MNALTLNLASCRAEVQAAYRKDEADCLQALLAAATFDSSLQARIFARAERLAHDMRRLAGQYKLSLDAFLSQYQLTTEEGLSVMCLAEALLRIPDNKTVDRLIRDKIGHADWHAHLGKSDFFTVNATTWGLLLTSKVVSTADRNKKIRSALKAVVSRSSSGVVRNMVRTAMRIVGQQFILGQNISKALQRSAKGNAKGFCYSYDMLGEAARTTADAERYFVAYKESIITVGEADTADDPTTGNGISVKLSALYPRYEFTQHTQAVDVLSERLLALAELAKHYNIGLTVDAEEADRLELSLDIIERVVSQPSLSGWQGFGLALQAYQKRAWYVIDWLAALAQQTDQRLMVRLVKGAYWDTEIKQSQVMGYSDYPVFTRKRSTDVSYIACMQKLFQYSDYLYPQFATHNAQTVATVLETAAGKGFEFQCLHGMGQALYHQITIEERFPCRIYAPVGGYEELLSYLVRRLLENGANTSFVNRMNDASLNVESLVADPATTLAELPQKRHPQIPLPADIFGDARKNAPGIDLTDPLACRALLDDLSSQYLVPRQAAPTIGAAVAPQLIHNPSQVDSVIGEVVATSLQQLPAIMAQAASAFPTWSQLPVAERAQCLMRIADLYEAHMPELIAIIVREAGKTIPDTVAEVREAIDFCRYYAEQAEQQLVVTSLPGPTGESNQLALLGRGVIVCISPWNFPLAIFTGQVVAALVAGNCVLAKPAEQTPLVAAKAVALMHEAGISQAVLQLVPGTGEGIGAGLVSAEAIDGVMFTGSTDTAQHINRALAARAGAIVPFIAETGGQNAMLVDSSALPEQVVVDVLTSAFGSAGQRCSACRVLYVQTDVADKLIAMLAGAAAALKLGDPSQLTTDIGPVIDKDALQRLNQHVARLRQQATLLFELPLATDLQQRGHFFAPCAFELSSLEQLPDEVFGPVLHVIRYHSHELTEVIDAINATGYGLTLGIHSRIDETIEQICRQARVGNIYVNRNMIGAVVGVQPFGGMGLSGTGPKAGGPHYLQRLCSEQVTTVNTAAVGGNASLVSLLEFD